MEKTILTTSEKEKQSVEKRLNKDKLRWEKWRADAYVNGIGNISKENSDLILRYLKDMESGINVSVKNSKGARSSRRLNDLKDKFIIFSKKFEELYGVKDLSKLEEKHLCGLFYGMQRGEIKTKAGINYKSVDTSIKAFKSFWHWYMKSNRKIGVAIEDITQDIDVKGEKPDWVYLTDTQIRDLANSMNFDYKVLIMFLLDTGIRAPLELTQVKVSDLYNNCKELNIRVYKKNSFARKIKLMLCSELLKTYIQIKNKSPSDYLFPICPEVVNRNLKKAVVQLLGDETTLAGHKYSQLTMYDFRHCSCCYWLPRYPGESGLKYRFGWKKSDKIHYYSELLGMSDTISEGDLLLDVTKTELDNKVKKIEQENIILNEKVAEFEKYIKIIDEISRKIEMKLG